MERIRDLFEQALKTCEKADKLKLLYYINIEFEENFGFTSFVYNLFEDCIWKIKPEEKLEVINYYISKAS